MTELSQWNANCGRLICKLMGLSPGERIFVVCESGKSPSYAL
jgi:hypothetical protein